MWASWRPSPAAAPPTSTRAGCYGYQHLSNALYRADPEAAAACMAELPPAARADFAYNNAYWASWEGPVREVGETVYDSFLRSYGQELGMQSYGACVDLLVAEFLSLAL